jgi:hypothetical protein
VAYAKQLQALLAAITPRDGHGDNTAKQTRPETFEKKQIIAALDDHMITRLYTLLLKQPEALGGSLKQVRISTRLVVVLPRNKINALVTGSARLQQLDE